MIASNVHCVEDLLQMVDRRKKCKPGFPYSQTETFQKLYTKQAREARRLLPMPTMLQAGKILISPTCHFLKNARGTRFRLQHYIVRFLLMQCLQTTWTFGTKGLHK